MIYARTFLRAIRSGSSLPLLVEADDGRRYVVKAHGSGDGPIASVVDWIALAFGRELGLPMVEPHIIVIEPDFAQQAKDPEISELVTRSMGVNFATEFVEGHPATADAIDAIPEYMRDKLFCYDVLLLNVDRTLVNPNAMIGADGIRCLDFAAAMSLRSLILDKPAHPMPYFAQIKHNPLYRPDIDADEFLVSVHEGRASLGGIVADLPEPWLAVVRNAHDARQTLTDRLDSFMKSVDMMLPTWLHALDAIKVESAEARMLRYAENKASFEKRFGAF